MKKRPSQLPKLVLGSETVRQLDHAQLVQIVGGATTVQCRGVVSARAGCCSETH